MSDEESDAVSSKHAPHVINSEFALAALVLVEAVISLK